MPVAYTSRKGQTYYLCQGTTETGKLRDYFDREPINGSPDQIPEGYRINESVNGVVSLVKDLPPHILPQEVVSVEAALDRHLRCRDFRVGLQKNQILMYERLGPDLETLSAIFGNVTALQSETVKMRLQEEFDKMARFSPILRFILVDMQERKFKAERWSYLGDDDIWIDAGASGDLEQLADRLIPLMGSDEFFELY